MSESQIGGREVTRWDKEVQGERERQEGPCKDWARTPTGPGVGSIQEEGPRHQGQRPRVAPSSAACDLGRGAALKEGPHLSLNPPKPLSPEHPACLPCNGVPPPLGGPVSPWAPLLGCGSICKSNCLAPCSHPLYWHPQQRCHLGEPTSKGAPPHLTYTQEPATPPPGAGRKVWGEDPGQAGA